MITKIPSKAVIKKKSAIVSNRFSFFGIEVLMDINENKQEKVSIIATNDVTSSIS
jgi:hypothetical protein